MRKSFFVVGIDEAGRGPLAGPLAVAAVCVQRGRSDVAGRASLFKGIKDSKKLSARKREEWQKVIKKNFESHYVFISHSVIDKIGMGQALKLGVEKVLEKFSRKPGLVLMDGSLKAPKEYRQQTIIKGDEKVPLISAASIVAKVARDKKMINLDKKHPQYGFAVHKGYGTKKHFEKIIKHGFCDIHRKTFCKNIN